MRSNKALLDIDACRDLRHAWSQLRGWQEGRNFIRIMECERCATQRIELLDRSGCFVKKPLYKYPKTYKIPGGPLAADERAWIRILSITTPKENWK